MTPQVSLSTPLTCVLSHLSLSHTGEPGSLPINNDTLAAFAVGEPAVVNARAATAARIISNQPAGLTQKLYLAHFTRCSARSYVQAHKSVGDYFDCLSYGVFC